MRLALTFNSVLRMPIDDVIQCSVAAEKAGFHYISIAESFYRDGFALASAIAANTTTIKFGTSVMPIYTRSPFQLGMGAATLNEISHGRMGFLGLGIGYKKRTQQYFGISQTGRLDRMREYVEIIKKLLAGGEATHHGQLFNMEKFPRLAAGPLSIPIYFGSSAPAMLQLCGEIADGVILNSLSTPGYLAFVREKIAEGARRVGRTPSEIVTGHSIIYAVADESEEAADAAKEDILFYVSYQELDPVIERSPFKGEVAAIRELQSRGDKKGALALVSDDMLDAFAVYGTPNQCRERLREFIKRGVDLPVIRVSVMPYDIHERKVAFLRAIDSLKNWQPN